MRPSFTIGSETVQPGERRLIDLPVSKLSNHTPVTLPVHVLHGVRNGPTLFVSAAIHGDELNGVEIIRQILRVLQPGKIGGTLLCAPVVNAYGFIGRSRYLPDRRDLNRSFPGSPNGSLAARLAHLFLTEVVRQCTIGIDLHTAAVHRVNLPQIRCEFDRNPDCRKLAEAFGAKVILESPERPGSLRQAAREMGVPVLVYEGGEGLRFNEAAIDAGVAGIYGVMANTGMLEKVPHGRASLRPKRPPLFANAAKWVRAPEGGVLRTSNDIGDEVDAGDEIGVVANPYEDKNTPVHSPQRGIVIGKTTLPIVNMGDALFHIAWFDTSGRHSQKPIAEPVMDEDEII